MTADASLFAEAVEIGCEIIWLHCFGERFADPGSGRPGGPPRMPEGERPVIPKDGAIPTSPDRFPGRIKYDAAARRLTVGDGFIDNVPPAGMEVRSLGQASTLVACTPARLAIAAVLLSLSATALAAGQTTGSIEGAIVDPNGSP